MNSSHEDLIELFGFVWQRFRRRMDGLTDAEYFWEPVPDCRTVRSTVEGPARSDGPAQQGDHSLFTTLAWRLCHIVDLLWEDRTGPWLGQPDAPRRGRRGDAGTAAEVLIHLDQAYASWHRLLLACAEPALQEPIGPVGGLYAESTRRSFALHILDELIHHGAEAALLRDLYLASKA
ncbi:MAG TPA: DinB family protein [Micromonosporaceae bacterium]|nr:DinB family protein [Micromonosporaceae bacterium]